MRISIDKTDRAYPASIRIRLPIWVTLDGKPPAGLVVTADSDEGIVRYLPRLPCGTLVDRVEERRGLVHIEILPEISGSVH